MYQHMNAGIGGSAAGDSIAQDSAFLTHHQMKTLQGSGRVVMLHIVKFSIAI